MELNDLRYALAIGRSGSITGAARALGLGQSTLSEAMRRLETELGSTLFLRTRDGVQPTATGQLVLDRAAAVLGLVEQAVDEVRALERDEVGRFTIGCHDSLGSYFLPEFLATFLHECPRIELSLFNAASGDVREAVVRREVHFGLVVNCVPHPDLVIVDAFHDAIRVLGLGDPPATRADADAIVRAGPLIWPARGPFDEVVRRLAALNLLPERRLPCGDLGLARALALAGIGPVVLPVRVAQAGGAALTPLHPELPAFHDTIHLVWRADLPRGRAMIRVRDSLLARGAALDA